MRLDMKQCSQTRTMLFLLAALAGASILPVQAQSLWVKGGMKANLIADNVARQKGDILTIIIRESQKLKDKQEVKLEKDTSLDSVLQSFNIAPNAFSTLPDLKTETKRYFDGKSDYKKEGNFEARISVTVKDVLPNGNLIIEGRRKIYMDDEEKTIKISGVVRPFDITPENTVASEKVSDARVSYDGEGSLSHNTERNWLDQLFAFLWPF